MRQADIYLIRHPIGFGRRLTERQSKKRLQEFGGYQSVGAVLGYLVALYEQPRRGTSDNKLGMISDQFL